MARAVSPILRPAPAFIENFLDVHSFPDSLLRKCLKRIGAFGDFNRLIARNSAECLNGLGRWPEDFEFADDRCIGQANRFDKRVSAEASVVADGSIDGLSRTVRSLNHGLNCRTNGRSIRFCANQLYLQPVIGISGVLKEQVIRPVTRNRSTSLNEQIDKPVAVPVGE